MKLPAIFLDLDDTILDFHWAEKRALSATMQNAGVTPTEELLRRYSDINRSQWELLEEGVLTRDQVLLTRFEILFAEQGIAASAEAIRDEYEHRLSMGHRFLPGAEEMLRAMQGRFSLYLASNGSAPVQEARIKSSGIAPYFDGIFISAELGADKPSLEYYRRCFDRIPDFDISRALMVGDSLTSDIRGGLNAGMLTCWLNPAGKEARPDIRPDYEIRSLDQLLPLAERLFQ